MKYEVIFHEDHKGVLHKIVKRILCAKVLNLSFCLQRTGFRKGKGRSFVPVRPYLNATLVIEYYKHLNCLKLHTTIHISSQNKLRQI